MVSRTSNGPIAQWAVNVVDYRDTDSAMTRFEFDIFPFGIGTVPTVGKPSTLSATSKLPYWAPDYVALSYGVPKEFCGVVWGMEMPELLLTESLALHDKRIRDTDADTDTGKTRTEGSPDNDFDQYRFPLASLFLELYCPRSTAAPSNTIIPGAPSSMYVQASDNKMKLRLGKTVSSGTFGDQPVWRIGITENNPAFNPNTTLQSTPDAMKQVTNQFSTQTFLDGTGTGTPDEILGSGLHKDFSTTTAPPLFDRMVWFTGYNGQTIPNLNGANQGNRVYFNQSMFTGADAFTDGTPLLAGGSYLVVGPRAETPLGSLTANPFTGDVWTPQFVKASFTTARTIPIRSPSHQSINLFNNSVRTTFLDGTAAESVWLNPTARIRPALGMICGTNPPDDLSVLPNASTPTGPTEWTPSFPTGVGLNVSLPTPMANTQLWAETYRPRFRLNNEDRNRTDGTLGYGDATAPDYFPPDSWVNVAGTSLPATVTGAFPDRPFDYPDPADPMAPTLNEILNPSSGGTPMYTTGTYQNVRAAYLQRLADPEFGYDPVTNPYITVDWISIDLTVFNGEAPPSANGTAIANGDRYNTIAQVAEIALQSRYKDGDVAYPAPTPPKNTIEPAGHPMSTGVGGLTYHSPSTGQLRTTVDQPDPTVANRYPSYFMHQIGYTSQQSAARPGSSATTLGYLNVGYRRTELASAAENGSDFAVMYDGFGPPKSNSDPDLYGAAENMTSLAWLNRPFASPHELMLVPLTGPGQFGFYHSVFSDDNDQRHPFRFLPSFQTMNAWRVVPPTVPVAIDQTGYWAQPASQTTRTGGEFPPAMEADWPLLLEFVETRPQFVDSRKVYDPRPIISALNPNYPLAPTPDPGTTPVAPAIRNQRFMDRFLDSRLRINYMSLSEPAVFLGPTLRPPFNMTSSYRAAGKVNLNTITQERNSSAGIARSSVLKGLEYNYLVGTDRIASGLDTDRYDPLTDQFMNTRRGYPTGVVSPFFGSDIAPHLNYQYPTQFVGAYRSPLTSNLAPYVQDTTAQAKLRSKFGVEATLARSFDLANQNAATLSGSAATDAMLFSPNAVTGLGGSTVSSATIAADADRNAFTRLQREMRLPNLITNQSNVFAVWVTVMLYEYDPVTGFGNEYLDENGLPKRERMFYIIDRSIPVGYKPGENLNTDRTILLKRKLD